LLAQVIGGTSPTLDPNQKFQLSSKYVHNSLQITIGGDIWPLYNSFGLMGPTTKGAVVQIDENGDAALVFGDGINGLIPPISQTVYGDYKESEGISGNLPPNTLTVIQSSIVLPTGIFLQATNPDYSSNGTNFQNLNEIRDMAPRSIRTLDRAVSYQDYVDIAMQVPGVGAAEVAYCCGKYVDVYIAPNSVGTATTALVARVKNYMDCRVMVTTVVDVKPSGMSRIWLKATIIAKPLYTEAEVKAQVINALDANFGVLSIEINKRVSITNIISVLEGLSKVDTVEIEQVRVEPYARPVENTNSILNITWQTLPHTTVKATYRLVYRTATTDFELYKNGVFVTLIDVGVPFNDAGTIGFTPLAGTYTDNNTWEFTVHPSYPEIFPDTLILIKDYSAPIIDVSPFISDALPRTIFSDLTIETQGSNASCLPPCN